MKPAFVLSLLVLRLGLPDKAQSQPPQFTISTVAGTGISAFSGDGGLAVNASLSGPTGMAVDAAGNLYIADANNNRIRKITPQGIISTYAGTGAVGFGGDGGPATKSLLNAPIHVSMDSGGNLFIADQFNHRIRKVDAQGNISTFAGSTRGYCGDGGPAVNACLDTPWDVFPDNKGNLFIADSVNSVVRKVDANGIITTVAGNGKAAYSGDGALATSASIVTPGCVTVSANGDYFIADFGNNRVRKVSNGIISTYAGNGVSGYRGDGGPATLAELGRASCVRLDNAGNLFIADGINNRVRVVLAAGTLWSVAGNGIAGSSGDNGPATAAELVPSSLQTSPSGAVYVADPTNARVRLLTPILQLPAVSPGGVVSASAFGGFTAISPGSWIEIYGTNLASDTRSWGSADFNGVNAPTSLDGTSVAIGGQAAFVDFISPGQVNALVPSNTPTGLQHLTVTTGNGTSAAVNVTVNSVQPGLLAPPSFTVSGTPYAVALFADGTYALPPGAIPGINSRPAKPGDVIVLYGVGFGSVIPALQAGQLVQQANALAASFQIQVGGMAATALYAGLAPNYSGLYQFNITVPNVAAGNAIPLTFTLGNVTGSQALFIAVQN